jgi:hypothetical protein
MHITSEGAVIEIAVDPGVLTMIVGNGIGLTLPVEAAPEAAAFAPNEPAANGELLAEVPPAPRRS